MSQIPSSGANDARRGRTRYDRCPTCKNTDVTGLHVDRCAETERYRQQAISHGRAAGIPDATTDDLWAHMQSRTHNVVTATAAVRVVIDLGWRPVVGSEPKRLWTDTTPP